MKTKCYSVRLKSLEDISDKAYKAISFDGSQDILPKSQVFGIDYSVSKSDAYWVAAWILEKKSLQYSHKKVGWFNPNTRKIDPNITKTVSVHVPEEKQAIKTSVDENLTR